MYDMMLRQSADVVYGMRRSRAGETCFKKKSAEAFYRLLVRITRVHIPVDTGNFRLMSRRIWSSARRCRSRIASCAG